MIRVTPADKLTSWRASMAELRQLSSSCLTTPVSSPITRAIKFSKVQNTVQRQGVPTCARHETLPFISDLSALHL